MFHANEFDKRFHFFPHIVLFKSKEHLLNYYSDYVEILIYYHDFFLINFTVVQISDTYFYTIFNNIGVTFAFTHLYLLFLSIL